MKPTQKSTDLRPLLVFGAHPDDIEFGCGGVIAKETAAGRKVHFVVCSRGEAASHGTPEQRVAEAEKSARILGATIQLIELGGDALLEIRAEYTVKLAEIVRTHRPGIVLAPTPCQNQHPDHWKLGLIVRDASRLARYGGMERLKAQPAHAIDQLLYYAITPQAEPPELTPLLIDVSDEDILSAWKASMEAHASQARTRDYVNLQLNRARLHGALAGVEHAIALFSPDPILLGSLAQFGRGARQF
jgi:LmbE family N-acetylglucosaminyl deacetylase